MKLYYVANLGKHGLIPFNWPMEAPEALSFVEDAERDGFAVVVRDDLGRRVPVENVRASTRLRMIIGS